MKKHTTYYGFYSKEADQGMLHIYKYRTPDGKEVALTWISSDPTGSDYNYPDKISLGVVTEYIETINKFKSGSPKQKKAISEAKGEETWEKICGQQGWNDHSKIILLERFIRKKKLFAEFANHAEKNAHYENKHA